MFQKIEKEERHNFVMKTAYEDWKYNTHNVIANLWRIEDNLEKLSNSPTKEEITVILSDLQRNINKSIWDGCPVGRTKKVEDKPPYSAIIHT